MRNCSGNNRCSQPATAMRSGLAAVVMLAASSASAGVAAAQEPLSVERVVGIDVLNPHGGVGERGVRSLGFVVGEELVVAKLDWNPGVFSNDPGFYAVTLGAEVFPTPVLVDYDKATGLALIRVPGLRATPYAFARSARLPGAVTGVVGYATPDGSTDPDQSRYLVDSLAFVSGQGTVEGRGTLTHDAFIPGHVNVGSPMFNGCGEVVGVTFDVANGVAAGIPAADLTSLFDADWEPVTAAAACAATATAPQVPDSEQADSLVNVAQAYRDTVGSLRDRVAALRNTAEDQVRAVADSTREVVDRTMQIADSTRAVADSLDDLANIVEERVRRTEGALEELEFEMERRRSTYLLRMGIALAVAASAFVLVVLGFRSARRARRQADMSDSDAARAKAEVARRRAKDRHADEFPSLFLHGKDDKRRDVAVRVPGRSIAAEDGAIVGRSPRVSAIVIDHESVSRRHFRLSASGEHVQIEDLNSTNGTTVDGVRLVPGKAMSLAHGAAVGIGPLTLTVAYR